MVSDAKVTLDAQHCIAGCGREYLHWVESGELPLFVAYCGECVPRCKVPGCGAPLLRFVPGGEMHCERAHGGVARPIVPDFRAKTVRDDTG